MAAAPTDASELFCHVSAEKASFYRIIMDVFAAAKRQYRLQLRPDEVLAEARWLGEAPRIEEVNAALAQLTEWGNLQAQPDTARVASLSDFYLTRFLYRLSQGGEAVEAALGVSYRPCAAAPNCRPLHWKTSRAACLPCRRSSKPIPRAARRTSSRSTRSCATS
jgi:Protein of unknown function (DUF2397)